MLGLVNFLAKNQYHLWMTTVTLNNYSITPVKKCSVYPAPGISLDSTFYFGVMLGTASQSRLVTLSILWNDTMNAILEDYQKRNILCSFCFFPRAIQLDVVQIILQLFFEVCRKKKVQINN